MPINTVPRARDGGLSEEDETMDQPEVDTIIRRLERLERVHRRWRVLGWTLIALVGGVVLMGAMASQRQEVATETRTRALVLVDREGKPRVDLRVAADDSTHLALMDREGINRISLSVLSHQGAHVMLMDPDGRARASLSVLGDGRPGLSLFDGDARPQVRLGVFPDGKPAVAVFSRDGTARWSAP
jgi:hypothetical protein